MLLSLFLKRGIEKRARLQTQRAAVRALDQSAGLQVLQVFADGDLRDAERTRELANQNPALVLHQGKDVPAALVNEHLAAVVRIHGYLRWCSCHTLPTAPLRCLPPACRALFHAAS